MVSRYVFIISLLLLSCGRTETDPENDVIAVAADVMDALIDSANPDRADNQADAAFVGFQDGLTSETRLLIFLPALTNLYQESVVLSSIADIRLELYADGVAVNPDNIRLFFIGLPWTPYVSWHSRFNLSDDYDWQQPGGDLLNLDYATPDIEDVAGTSLKMLSFDVTEQVIASIIDKQTIYGFALIIQQSDLNRKQSILIRTTNGSDSYDPRAVLSYSQEDILQP